MTTDANSSGPENDRALACLAYLALWVTGLIIFLTSKKEEKLKRWHSIQAIGLGVVAFGVGILLNMFVGGLVLMGAGPALGGFGMIVGGFWIVVVVLVVVLMVKTYQGETVRLPVLAEFADKNA